MNEIERALTICRDVGVKAAIFLGHGSMLVKPEHRAKGPNPKEARAWILQTWLPSRRDLRTKTALIQAILQISAIQNSAPLSRPLHTNGASPSTVAVRK